MECNGECRGKPLHLWSNNFWQGHNDHAMGNLNRENWNGASSIDIVQAEQWSKLPTSHHKQKLSTNGSYL